MAKVEEMDCEGGSTSLLTSMPELHHLRSTGMFNLYLSGQLCDIKIICGIRKFSCHRVLLASVSKYFYSMFTSNSWIESDASFIEIKDIEPEAMDQLITFCYTGLASFTIKNVQSILYAASVLQVEPLAQSCCQFMKNHLHSSNVLGVRLFAEQHGCTSLMEVADSFLQEHFLDVIYSEEFLAISSSHLQTLLSADKLNVRSEVEVYEALMMWVHHKPKERSQSALPRLLQHIRLSILPVEFLIGRVETEPLIRCNLPCRDLLDAAKNFHLTNGRGCTMVKPRRSCAGVLFCVGGRGRSGDPFRSVECYDPRRDSWMPVSDMGSKRRHVGVLAIGDLLYAIGGHTGGEHISTGEVFSMKTGQWRPIAPMLTFRRGLALASLGSGPIYAIGGLDDKNSLNVVERYDPEGDSWSSVQPTSLPRGGVAVASLNGFIYAIGGNDGTSSLESCEKYNPLLNRWSFIENMNTRRAGAGVATVDGALYVIGGFDDCAPLSTSERYDVTIDCWTIITCMSCCRGGVGVAACAGKVYAVGGHDGKNYLNLVEAYDTETQKWETVSSTHISRAGAGLAFAAGPVPTLKYERPNINSADQCIV